MTMDTRTFTELLTRASPDTLEFVQTVLEQDQVDRQWAAQIGTALSQPDVARLLHVSVQAVSKNRGLLRLTNRDGRVVYPVMQFDGRRPLPGLARVLGALDGSLLPLTVASWLTLATPALDDNTPVHALRDGDIDRVVALAHQVAQATA